MSRNGEKGQAIILVVVSMGLVLIGALGLAIDGAQIYANRVLAQAAADAAAQAGIMAIFDGNWANPVAGTCTTTSTLDPCIYARNNSFGQTADDVVAFDFPSAASVGVDPTTLSSSDPVNLLRVTITRTLQTSLMRLLGSPTSSAKAVGVAAIVSVIAPIPIIVTHPTLPGSLRLGGNPNITICGGAGRSIQVNSSDVNAVDTGGSNATVNLSRAGTADLFGDCSRGTGADFGNSGGPASSSTPSWLTPVGSTEHYIQPASWIKDPLAGVAAPSRPAVVDPAKAPLANGVSGCPASPPKPCQLYSPGAYSSGINVQNETAVFIPGLYYMDTGGFQGGAHGTMVMATGFPNSTETGGQGMVVYNHGGGTFAVGANGDANLTGASDASAYKGILFFQDRNSPAATGGGGSHTLGGGGNLVLNGTIYITNTTMTSTVYQNVRLRGNSGNQTLIRGEIIVSALDLGGGGAIQMNLNPASILTVRQVALVK